METNDKGLIKIANFGMTLDENNIPELLHKLSVAINNLTEDIAKATKQFSDCAEKLSMFFEKNWQNMKYKQVCYSIEAAEECGEKRNPYEVMKSLGFKIIASVPQTLYNTIWFTVEDYVENPPEFITKMWYNYDYWHNDCYENCEYFKKDNTCCHGGYDCLKDYENSDIALYKFTKKMT